MRPYKLTAISWFRRFDDPIPLPRGRALITLKEAAEYIQKLPKAEQQLEEWQAAVEALLLVIELSGPTMMARIGILRALNRNVETRPRPDWVMQGAAAPRPRSPMVLTSMTRRV